MKQSTANQLINAVLLLLAPVPSIIFAYYARHVCTPAQKAAAVSLYSWRTWVTGDGMCAVAAQHPVATVMWLFTINVDLLFWLVSLLQRSTWLIDPYWTIIPPLIGAFYWTHPAAQHSARSVVAMALLLLWSVRLTHSYFRRERWQLGAREDWRFERMRAASGRHWVWLSLPAVYVSQQFMLVGITWPLAAFMFATPPWRASDSIACALCITGIAIAFVADTQLHAFCSANERRRAKHESPVAVLDTGLWRYSRHPNYFGEQLWWWGLAVQAACLGQPWTMLGAAFNSLCMVQVTVMVEQRMLESAHRAAAYKAYQRTTSVWLPLPKFQQHAKST